ncbi:MAG: phosphonate ABC transporter substrate-binding protein, partial [Geobacteraceae bacterium GWC2_48_7]
MSWCRLPLLIITIILSLTFGCSTQEPPFQIDTSKTETVKQFNPKKEEKIRIALGGMITPKEGLVYYREFLDYLGKEIGRPIEYVDAEDYAEINKKLEVGELEGAFVCSGPYVDGKNKFGLEFVAAPYAYGEKVYYSYFIVPINSPAKSLDDLRGKTFAFTDPLSNSGRLVPEFALAQKGEKASHFFREVSYSGSHDKSIQAVSGGLVDGAAVDSLIWEYMHHKYPEKTAKTRIIYKSEPYASPPFVVRSSLDPATKAKLRNVILNAHKTPKGRVVLKKMMIDRFGPLDDSAYDS